MIFCITKRGARGFGITLLVLLFHRERTLEFSAASTPFVNFQPTCKSISEVCVYSLRPQSERAWYRSTLLFSCKLYEKEKEGRRRKEAI